MVQWLACCFRKLFWVSSIDIEILKKYNALIKLSQFNKYLCKKKNAVDFVFSRSHVSFRTIDYNNRDRQEMEQLKKSTIQRA